MTSIFEAGARPVESVVANASEERKRTELHLQSLAAFARSRDTVTSSTEGAKMKVITTVRLHRTKGYPMDVIWFEADPHSNQRVGPDIEVHASSVFDELQLGRPVTTVFQGGLGGPNCRAVTLEEGIETFELEASRHYPDKTLRDLLQLEPLGGWPAPRE